MNGVWILITVGLSVLYLIVGMICTAFLNALANEKVLGEGAAFLAILLWPILAVILFFGVIYVVIDRCVNRFVKNIRTRKERKSR